ncbi:MAG TPA: diguanylate cyclase response regulator [Geobacter sp.]|nr:diguanylate cyclase response regulator [Geobacter sp.]
MNETGQIVPENLPILIVDDNRLQRSVLEANLKAAGYQVVAAENGKEALEIFRKGHFPILMTDWIMPEMSGLELCRAIRAEESGRYTYIIILTSLDSKNDIIAGLEAGADEYLVKPAHQAELTARLKTARRILDLENARNRYIEEIKSLSLIDPPTGIFNRCYMDEHISQEIKRAYRYERSLALILVGVNRFSETVAEFGHFSGDVLLKRTAECLTDSVRKDVDWIARYGEDAFMVVLPETDTAGALIVAKRLRIRIATMVVKMYDKELRISAGFGVAGFTASQQKLGFTTEIFLDKVDHCLCQAREEGGETIKGVQIG